MVIAQASLSILLALNSQVDKERITMFPLANYAARYWVEPCQIEDVSFKHRRWHEMSFRPCEATLFDMGVDIRH